MAGTDFGAVARPYRRGMRTRILLAVLAACALALVPSSSAYAATATSCGELSAARARTDGQRFMERMLGSTGAREAMDRTMASMLGPGGVRQVHEMMGRSASGCPAGEVPEGMSRMVAAMGAMTGMMGGGSPYYGGMMGAGDRDDRDRGMMRGDRFDAGSEIAETIMIVLMTLLVVAVLVAVAVLLTRRTPRAPELPSAGA